MYKGKIVESGLASDVINNPLHPYTQLLIDSVFPIGDMDWKVPDIAMDEGNTDNEGCKFYNRCKLKSCNCLNSSPKLEKVENEHFVACHNLK